MDGWMDGWMHHSLLPRVSEPSNGTVTTRRQGEEENTYCCLLAQELAAVLVFQLWTDEKRERDRMSVDGQDGQGRGHSAPIRPTNKGR